MSLRVEIHAHEGEGFASEDAEAYEKAARFAALAAGVIPGGTREADDLRRRALRVASACAKAAKGWRGGK